jgi:hypothetical protein
MKLKVCLLIGALVAPLFSHAADQERKPDTELSYPEQLAQYNKLKQPAQDFMDKIIGLRVKADGLMSDFYQQAVELSSAEMLNQWDSLDEEFNALRSKREELFGSPPVFHFSECSEFAGLAVLAWDAQYSYFTAIAAGRLASTDDFSRVVRLDTAVARMAARCQQGIDIPPENNDDGIIVDKDTPVD